MSETRKYIEVRLHYISLGSKIINFVMYLNLFNFICVTTLGCKLFILTFNSFNT